MSGRNPTAAEIAQRETSAAAGIALNELRTGARMIVTGAPDAPTQAALEDMAHHAARRMDPAALTWRPLDQLPQPVDRHHTALVLCDDGESWWLRSGVVDWNDSEWYWEDEESGEPLEVREGTRYYWCYENEIIAAAMAQLAKVGAGDTAAAEGGIQSGTNRTSSGAIGQP